MQASFSLHSLAQYLLRNYENLKYSEITGKTHANALQSLVM